MKQRTEKELGAQQRAYSIIEIKAVDEEKRIIEGIASTPTPDRMEDIVEPMGAQYKLPLPFLWQHDSGQPIGHVIAAKPNKSGIPVTIRVERANADDPASLRELLDNAWAMIKKKLVRGLSIGFQPTEWSEIKGTYGYRYLKWDWLELSAVTIPANAEATITAIKSADQRARAALGAQRTGVVRLDAPSAGASASTAATPKGNQNVKTIKEQKAAFEATRAAKAARMAELMNAAAEKGETLDDAAQQEYDGLSTEVKSIDAHLKRLDEMEKLNLAAVKAVPAAAASDETVAAAVRLPYGTVRTETNIPKGIGFARFALAKVLARMEGVSPLDIIKSRPEWKDQAGQLEHLIKAGVAGGTSTGSAWADDSVYAQNLVSEFIELLHPKTILGRLTGLRRVPFNIRVGSQTSGGTAYWVGEGKPIPVSKQQTDNVTLTIAKAAGLQVITKELARLSSPSAEAMVRDDLMKTVIEFLDKQFVDPNYGPVTASGAPGSITYAVTPTTPTGTTAAALRNDISTLIQTFLTNNLDPSDCVWIMSPNIALQIGMIYSSGLQQFPTINANGGSLGGFPVITSYSAYVAGSPDYAHMMLLVKPSEIFIADDGQMDVEASDQVSIQMDDAPTNDTPTPTATSLVSMFQTESMAIKLVRYINWKKRRSTAVNFIRTAAYKDA